MAGKQGKKGPKLQKVIETTVKGKPLTDNAAGAKPVQKEDEGQNSITLGWGTGGGGSPNT